MPATKLTQEQERYIVEAYAGGTGKYAKELARELCVEHQVVTNCLRRNGVVVVKRWNSPRGERSGGWRGGIRMIKGYRHKYLPSHPLSRKDGWIAEHRLIMSDKIIDKKQVVHHKDGNRLNNRRSNLLVMKDNGVHRSKHSKTQPRNGSGRFI